MRKFTFQISAELYWGFQVHLDESELEALDFDMLYKIIKHRLKKFLKAGNLVDLHDRVDDMKLHIHSACSSLEELIAQWQEEEIIYVCSHC